MAKKKSGLAFGTHLNKAGNVAKNKGHQNQVSQNVVHQGFGSFSFGGLPVRSRSGTGTPPGPPPVKETGSTSGSYTRVGAGFGDLGSGAPAQADVLGTGGGGGEGSQVLSPIGDIAYAIGSVDGKDVSTVIAQGARRTRKTRRPGSI